MPDFAYARLFALRNWISVAAAFSFFKAGSPAAAQNDATAATQNDSPAQTTVEKEPWELRLGPFDLHPRLAAGLTYDDNILYSTTNREADAEWMIQPAFQAAAGDDAALIAYRDQNYDVLDLSPGNLIIQQTDLWPGKVFLLDYGPRFQIFDKYTANNCTDEFGTLNLLWPMSKLILGLKQDYQLQKLGIIEAGERATVESISSALSAAYRIGDKTSLESNFRRVSFSYDQPGLTGYTEYNTEDWLNYEAREGLAVSLGLLAGSDSVANHQDQTYEQLRARARYSYTEKLAFDVSAGGESRQYENGRPDTLSPVFTLAGEYRPAARTSLRLTGSEQQYAAIYNGYNYASTGAALEIRQGMTDRFTAGLSAGYYSLDFTPARSALKEYAEDYYIVRISLEAKIVRHLNGQVFYQFLNSHTQTSHLLNDDQAGVQLTLSF
jgi:hypothetical protein